MQFLEETIDFQNKAEREFQENKNLKNLLNYLAALIIFFGSTIFASFTLPFRYIFKKISKTKKRLLSGNDGNIDEILEKEHLVLIDFWAEWCGPCLMMNPALKEFAENNKSVKVVKINADSNTKTFKRFGIKGLPHFLLFKNGKEIKRYAGSMTANGLHKFCFEE